MHELVTEGRYEITDSMKEGLKNFYGGFATQEETLEQIGKLYKDTGYVIDTHTAVASRVYDEYKKTTGDDTKTIIASTASPFKFVGNVMKAINPAGVSDDDFAMCDSLSKLANVDVPRAVEEIRDAAVLHSDVVEVDDMKAAVLAFLK